MVPRRRRAARSNRMAQAAIVSAGLHLAILAALIITFPNKTPPEAPPPTGVQMVFETGAKTPTAPKTPPHHDLRSQEAAPRGRPSPTPQHRVQASPPPAPLPRPEIKTPEPPHPVTPPKPVTPPPPPKPQPPKPQPAAPKPPPPALPKVALPPPPPPAPEAPKVPEPKPAPVPLPSQLTDNTPAEVNLNLPPLPEFAPMKLPEPPPPLPPAPPAPQKAAPTRRAGHGRNRVLSEGVLMNGMSFGGGGSTGGRAQGLNMQLPRSMQANPGSDLIIKGSPGKNWLAELQQWVNDRATYPEMAGEQGQQGSVTIRFTVDRAGHVTGLQMVTPTGYALLDQSWLGLFRNADLPPLGADAKSDSITVTATMHYEILH